MQEVETYSFSFTAVTMKLHTFMRVVKHVHENDINLDLDDVDQEAILEKGNERTSVRQFQELSKRLQSLTLSERDMLLRSDLPTQRQIAFLGICKTYSFIHDLVVEVLREKFLVYDYHFTEGDYRSFISRKSDLHPELEEFAETTHKKVKQHTFKILEQAGIIDDVKLKNIQPQILDSELQKVIVKDHPKWLKVFLISDKDIQLIIDEL